MPRLVPLDLNKLTPEQKKVADAIVAGPRGGLRGPFDPWLRRPELADRAQKLGEYCRFNNSMPRDLAELAICLVGRHFKAQYEFYAHARLAREAGLSAEIVEAVRTRQTPPFTRDVERIVYDFVTEYLETNRVSDAQLQARGRRLRRAGRGRSRRRLRLLHAGVDDPQRLRDAAAAGRAGSDRLERCLDDIPPLPGGRVDHRAVAGTGHLLRRRAHPGGRPQRRAGLEPRHGNRRAVPCCGGRGRHLGAGHGERRGLHAAEDRRRALSGLARHQDPARGPHRHARSARPASARRAPSARASWSRR